MNKAKDAAAVSLGSRGGRAAAVKMTPEQKMARSQKAAAAAALVHHAKALSRLNDKKPSSEEKG